MKSAFLCLAILVLVHAPKSLAQINSPELNRYGSIEVDRRIDPCTDFYRFTCSKWLSSHPLPENEPLWNTRSPLEMWNMGVLQQVLETAAQNGKNTRSANQQKLGDYWTACMNEPGIELAGTKDVIAELRQIDNIRSKRDLPARVAWLHLLLPGATRPKVNQTQAPLFGFTSAQDVRDASRVLPGWDQGGLALPSRDFYLAQDLKSSQIRAAYVAHIRRVFELAGERSSTAQHDAEIVLQVETRLARAQMPVVARGDPTKTNNLLTFSELQRLVPAFDFQLYLHELSAPGSHDQLVSSPEFFRELNNVISQVPLEGWKAYLKWWLLNSSADYLPRSFVEESFDFYGRQMSGLKAISPRGQRCVRAVDRNLGDALGEAYADRVFPIASKQRIQTMVQRVTSALRKEIAEIDWMDSPTKSAALQKLDAMQTQIGLPDRWRDYSSLRISSASYLENVHQATAYEVHHRISQIGKPLDRKEWLLTVPTVDAWAMQQRNTILLPAGVLLPPLFDNKEDESINYGGIGTVIAHEITHLFDSRGRKFDATGSLSDWWTAQAAQSYQERSQCFVDEYAHGLPDLGIQQDGQITLAENVADNGGLRLSLMALSTSYAESGQSLDDPGPDGWTPLQRFFLADALAFCENTRPEVARTWVLTNGHALPEFRVNDVVSNLPEFQHAFGCKQGQRMVRSPACRIW